MSNRHPLMSTLITWAQDPDAWQWRFFRQAQREWVDCTPWDALEFHEAGTRVDIVPKHSLIPADRLPEGWEVERDADGGYSICLRGLYGPKANGVIAVDSGSSDRGFALYELLRHIDPEAA